MWYFWFPEWFYDKLSSKYKCKTKKNYEEIADTCIPELIKDDEIMT